ncbi:hypothetical protein D9C73_014473 [Collichthys lucidus]|uniref:Uncharacterized protein n=1 Tax=Collichthys lucidus TaxID=240159 RepID=A0A4U5UVM5_COLLU|nr:hypothetical protein D9C73_014473 [Collichthys lucidus]
MRVQNDAEDDGCVEEQRFDPLEQTTDKTSCREMMKRSCWLAHPDDGAAVFPPGQRGSLQPLCFNANDSLSNRCDITEYYWRRTNNKNSKRCKKSIIQDEEAETAAEINEQAHAETIS